MEQTITCDLNNHTALIRDPNITVNISPRALRTPVNLHQEGLLDLQMPRIATMTPGRGDRIGHSVGQHEVISDVVLSSAADNDVIEPSILTNTCEWSAGRPSVIRMDSPNAGDVSHAAANDEIEQQQGDSARLMNGSGMPMPSSTLYQNPLNPMIDQNSNSNLASFHPPGLGPDLNSNWQISRHSIEYRNENIPNSTDDGHNSNSDANNLLRTRTMNPRSFNWNRFPQGPEGFPNDEDSQNETMHRQIQSSRRMTRSMRRRVMRNDQRPDTELRPLLDLNSTILSARPQRSPILTRNRTSPPSYIPNPSPVLSSTIARRSVPTVIRSSSTSLINSHSPPLNTPPESTSDCAHAVVSRTQAVASAAAASVSSQSPPKDGDRPATHFSRKRSANQGNISSQNESRKKAASTRISDVSQPMSTRSQSSALNIRKPKTTVDSKKLPAVEKELQIDDASKRCCICLEEPIKSEISKLDMCKHIYCFTCIEKWAERENTCPLCKTRFHKIERVHKVVKTRGRRGASQKGSPAVLLKNVKKVKNRDQRSDYGRNVQWQGLLERMEAGGLHHHFAQFIFSGLNAFGTPNGLMSFEANVPNQSRNGPFSSAISISQRIQSRQHSTPQRTTSNNRPTFTDYVPRSRSNNVARVREHHTIDDDVTRSLSALRSTLLSHRSGSISSSPDTPGPRATFADFQPPFTHGASEAFGVGDVDAGPRFNREADPFAAVDLDASMESNDDSEEEGNPGRFYQRIRDLRRDRNAVMERIHMSNSAGESGNFIRASAAFDHSASDGLGEINGSVFEDPFDRVMGVPRSFAANGHHADAGDTADTPLEIMDSDDDDEDDGVVEVLVVNEA